MTKVVSLIALFTSLGKFPGCQWFCYFCANEILYVLLWLKNKCFVFFAELTYLWVLIKVCSLFATEMAVKTQAIIVDVLLISALIPLSLCSDNSVEQCKCDRSSKQCYRWVTRRTCALMNGKLIADNPCNCCPICRITRGLSPFVSHQIQNQRIERWIRFLSSSTESLAINQFLNIDFFFWRPPRELSSIDTWL